MHPGSRITLTLKDFSYLGGAVGHTDSNLAVFVHGGLPGERVIAEIVDVQRRFARGVVVGIEEPAPERVAPRCPYFGACGGCQWQHLAYTAHLGWKEELLRRQLSRIGHLIDPPVRPTIPAVEPYAYRNHARLSVDPNGHLSFARFQTHDLLPIETCQIMQPAVAAVIERLRGVRLDPGQLVIRHGSRTGQLLISPELPAEVEGLASGQPDYEEMLWGRTYRVSAASFFQVNTRLDQRELPEAIRAAWLPVRSGWFSQVDLLALLVLDRLDLRGSELVVDAYCGVGTFSLLIAERAGRVVGIEESQTAVRDAVHNAQGMSNVEFRVGRTEDHLARLEARPDAVVLDPSRSGCDRRVLRALVNQPPATVIYVSCDPSTLARDLAYLSQQGFQIEEIQPIDMFPQTYHLETVTVLRAVGVD